MAISIEIRDKTPELMQKLNAAIGQFVLKGALYIQGQLQTSMAEPKTGRSYKRGKGESAKTHVASAAGESPAVDSSNLTGSIFIYDLFEKTLEAKIGTVVEYAPILENGTSRMAARPLWEKTATDSLPTLENMLQAEIRAI